MAAPVRILGFTPKPYTHPVPWIPSDWTVTVDLEGAASMYVEFSKSGLLSRQSSDALTERGIAALSAAHFLRIDASPITPAALPFAYSCTYMNDGFPLACLTLLQLGVRSRFHLFIERGGLCSFVVATAEPAVHVLRQFFREVTTITPTQFNSVASGKRLNPKMLTKFTLPAVLGVGGAAPLPIGLNAAHAAGEKIVLGKTISPLSGRAVADAEISLELLNRHVFVAGTSGSGKTNTVMRIVTELRGRVPVLVFDVKREYRTLARGDAQVYGFTSANLLTHNLLKPVGSPSLWVKEFSSILGEVINRSAPAVGSKDVVAATLDELYRERGVYDGSGDYPHLGELIDALEKRDAGSREAGWTASALRVLRSLTIGRTRDAFCVREGVAVERLLSGVAVVELDGLGDSAATALLVSVLLQKIRHKLADRGGEGLRNLIVIEEAQHILAAGSESTSVITETCREIRSFGVGLVFVTQIPSEFSKHAVANANTHIVHKLVHPSDKSFALNVLGLDADARSLLETLGVGRALLRVEGVSLLQIPEVERPSVRDDELRSPPVTRDDVATSFAARQRVANKLERLDEKATRVLFAIAEARAVKQSELAALHHMTGHQTGAILVRLAQRGLVGFCKVQRIGSGGRPSSVYFLRPDGEEAYRSRHGALPDIKDERSAPHASLVARTCAALRISPKPSPKHIGAFDIYYDDGCAIEVETGANKDDQLEMNVTKSLAHQNEAVFVCADATTYNRVLQTCARVAFAQREPVPLRIATIDALPEWNSFAFRPEPITP